MASFGRVHCPNCLTETWQRWLTNDPAQLRPGEEMRGICESCLTVLIYREDGWVGQRAAADEERTAVLPKIDTSAEPWDSMFVELQKGKTELRTWMQADCPGLTPEIEAVMLPGTIERLQLFVELPDTTDSDRFAEPSGEDVT